MAWATRKYLKTTGNHCFLQLVVSAKWWWWWWCFGPVGTADWLSGARAKAKRSEFSHLVG